MKILLTTLMLTIAAASATAQEAAKPPDELTQSKVIKVKRIAADWSGAKMELRLYDGGRPAGRFIKLDGVEFLLENSLGVQRTPVSVVESVVLKRKPQDLIFVGLAALGTAAILAGAVSLGSEASSPKVSIAMATGGVIGFTFGWKVFYQDTVIKLE